MDFVNCLPSKYREISYFFFFNDTATTEIYTLSLHDALPIADREVYDVQKVGPTVLHFVRGDRSEEHTSELQSRVDLVCRLLLEKKKLNLDVQHPVQEILLVSELLQGVIARDQQYLLRLRVVLRDLAVAALRGHLNLLFLLIRRPPSSPLFPYTTLFR